MQNWAIKQIQNGAIGDVKQVMTGFWGPPRRVEVTAVKPKLVLRVTDEHCPIRRKPAAVPGFETELHEPRAQFIRITRTNFQLECELRVLAIETKKPL